jgi:hypothetical protein
MQMYALEEMAQKIASERHEARRSRPHTGESPKTPPTVIAVTALPADGCYKRGAGSSDADHISPNVLEFPARKRGAR